MQGKIRELRRVFVYLDKNCDGVISADDLQATVSVRVRGAAGKGDSSCVC